MGTWKHTHRPLCGITSTSQLIPAFTSLVERPWPSAQMLNNTTSFNKSDWITLFEENFTVVLRKFQVRKQNSDQPDLHILYVGFIIITSNVQAVCGPQNNPRGCRGVTVLLWVLGRGLKTKLKTLSVMNSAQLCLICWKVQPQSGFWQNNNIVFFNQTSGLNKIN